MRTALAAAMLLLLPATLPAAAQNCYQWGNQTTCNSGVTRNHYGNEGASSNGNALNNGPVGVTGNPSASTQGCYQWGNQTACNNGATRNHYGNESATLGANPLDGNGSVGTTTQNSPATANGNASIAGIPNGTAYRVEGNTVYLSDGRTATIQGDTTTFSDGRRCRRSGTSSVCN